MGIFWNGVTLVNSRGRQHTTEASSLPNLRWKKNEYDVTSSQRARARGNLTVAEYFSEAIPLALVYTLENAVLGRFVRSFVRAVPIWLKMRTLEEVQATLQIAKLKEEDLRKTIQCLSYGDNVSSADYCLVELDDTLCKHIEAGQR